MIEEIAPSLCRSFSRFFLLTSTLFLPAAASLAQQPSSAPESLSVPGEGGHRGGRIVLALRAEPKTLNPLTAVDA
ncbi:MAG TPA: hypothetical protein VHM93_18640, partial [Candidatus Acidoferrum sp.]|nr:hypothetical protein [Candidatus Acidoferrum sp.]